MSTVPRVRQPWESYLVSGCIALVTVVATICLVILIIYAAMFGYAEMKAHWP